MARLGYIPSSIVGGETIWIAAANTTQNAEDIILTDYAPSDSWTLTYNFQATTPLSVAGVANGADTGWTLELTGTQTLTFTPGVVAYTALVSKDFSGTTRSFVVDDGTMIVEASPLRTSSWAAVLVSVDAAIADYAANPNGSITVDGMSLTYKSMAQLIALRDYVNYRLQQDSSNRPKRIIRSRFPV